MKERPILFSVTEVCAILDGTKTQTRRVVDLDYTILISPSIKLNGNDIMSIFKFGQIGEKLWVPTTFPTDKKIIIEIANIRIERLADISEEDAQSEGCSIECMRPTGDDNGSAIWGPNGFCSLWESIYGAGSWSLNPWVWVIEFKRV